MQALLLAFLILCVHGCHSQLQDQSLSQDEYCPLWFQYNKTLHHCQCPNPGDQGPSLTCIGEDAIVSFNYIATYDQNMKIITLSPNNCKLFNETSKPSGYVFLPRNFSRLNEYTCGPLNRKEYLYRDCMRAWLWAGNQHNGVHHEMLWMHKCCDALPHCWVCSATAVLSFCSHLPGQLYISSHDMFHTL